MLNGIVLVLLFSRYWNCVLRDEMEICDERPLNVGGHTTAGYVSEKLGALSLTINWDATVRESARAIKAANSRLMPALFQIFHVFFAQKVAQR